MTLKEFSAKVKNNSKRVHKITNSVGVYDAYRYIRRNKWFNIGRPLTTKEFYDIIKTVNSILADEFIKGNTVVFPYGMGKLCAYKKDTYVKFEDGKLKTNKKINWNETLKLWYEDEECSRNKTLIRYDNKTMLVLKYHRGSGLFNNKIFYSFKPNRKLNANTKEAFNRGDIDALQLNSDVERLKYQG